MSTKLEIFTYYLFEVQKILSELDYYKDNNDFTIMELWKI